jgi:hypothetical protein
MIVKLVILLLPFVGLVAAIWLLRKRIPRVVSILVIVVAATGGAWLTYFVIALSSVQCLGSCG